MPVDGHTLHPNPSKPSCSSLGHLARTSGPDRPLQGQSKQREGKGNCWLWYQPLNTESASEKQLWSEAEETVVNTSLAPHQSTQAADLGQHNLPALGGLTISQHLKSKYILQIIPGWSNPVYFHRTQGFLFLAIYLTGNLRPHRPLGAALSLQATELPPNTPCYSISQLSPCLYFKDQRTWLRAVLFRLIFSQKTAGFSGAYIQNHTSQTQLPRVQGFTSVRPRRAGTVGSDLSVLHLLLFVPQSGKMV